MSNCGCKSTNSVESIKLSTAAFGSSIFVKLIIFIFAIIIVVLTLIPIILPMVLIMLFNKIVRDKNTDVTNGLLSIGKILRTSKKRDEESDDDYENINDDDNNSDDYELMNVDIVK